MSKTVIDENYIMKKTGSTKLEDLHIGGFEMVSPKDTLLNDKKMIQD